MADRREYWVIHRQSFLMVLFGFFAAGLMGGLFLGVLMVVAWS